MFSLLTVHYHTEHFSSHSFILIKNSNPGKKTKYLEFRKNTGAIRYTGQPQHGSAAGTATKKKRNEGGGEDDRERMWDKGATTYINERASICYMNFA